MSRLTTWHSSGAMKAAKVIANGAEKIDTEYGMKSVEGVADIIENETGVLVLLAAAREVRELFTDIASGSGTANSKRFIRVNAQLARAINDVVLIKET